MKLLVGFACGLFLVSSLGCGAASNDAAGPPPVLSGVYQATSPGPIDQISFEDDGHYFLAKSGCDSLAGAGAAATGGDDTTEFPVINNPCIESGTYVLNDARDTLSLTDDATGQTTAMPFKVLAASTTSTQSLEPLGGLAPGGQGSLTNGAAPCLVTPGFSLIASFNAAVQGFKNLLSVQTPPEWDRTVTRPQNEGAASQQRSSCRFTKGTMPAETVGADIPVTTTMCGRGLPDNAIPVGTVVVLMQENRSFDSYFARLGQYMGRSDIESASPGATQPQVAANATSGTVPLIHAPALCGPDTIHDWWAVHMQYDNGQMDGFYQSNQNGGPGGQNALWWYDQTDIPFYYKLASTFAIGDHYHSSILGPTSPNRDYLYGASSHGVTSDSTVPMDGLDYPDHDVLIFDLLEKRHITWKVYMTIGVTVGGVTGGVAGVEGFLGGALSAGNTLTRWGVLAYPEHFRHFGDFIADAKNGTLPSVVFVDPQLTGEKPSLPLGIASYNTKSDEHPPGDIQVGQKFTSDVVHALMGGPQWPNAALFITWDEHGGYYDHVAPPAACPPDDIAPNLTTAQDKAYPAQFDRLGMRVPVIVVSPFAKPHYVSHNTYDHTSIIRFIETKFKLPALTARDANADPMFDFFDFKNVPFKTPPSLASATVDTTKLAACKAQWDK